jgi:hypothetical protein
MIMEMDLKPIKQRISYLMFEKWARLSPLHNLFLG